jgi:lysine 2,3-aminomutase
MLTEKITSYYRSLIDPEDPFDPLLRMVNPSDEETEIKPGESDDPIGDIAHGRCANGRLVHRYPDRVLLLVTDRCPAHCRFCFRKRIVGKREEDISDQELEDSFRYISSDDKITEIILSGGDPLSIPDKRLREIIEGLKKNGGARKIRLHTRYPVYEPSRCEEFTSLACLVDTIVTHVNHSREITPAFRKAATVLHGATFLLNQSVLLRGVNDSPEEIEALSQGLASAGILPYYLHYPDIVPGTSHFRIPLTDAVRLADSLQGRMPGYLVPKLVMDIPGGRGKIVLSGSHVGRTKGGSFLLNECSRLRSS